RERPRRLNFSEERPVQDGTSLERNFHFGPAAGRSRIHGCRNSFHVQADTRPLRSAQHHKGDAAARKVLLTRSLAFVTVWPGRNWAIPRGVTWSKRMSIHGGVCSGDNRRDGIETMGRKLKNRGNLLPRDVEL